MFSRSKEQFVTRLTVNNSKIDQKRVSKILGCWVDDDAGNWVTNTKELCKSAYSRISMLTKLKYIGVSTEDLIEIYSLFIRSRAEYVSVVWHSSLTVEQTKKIENIQKTSLKIILGEDYIDYPTALEWCGLSELSARRQNRCLSYAHSSLKYPVGARMFPLNIEHDQNVRNHEKFKVNFAHTERYRQSAVPFCQRLLNQDASARSREARARTAEEARRGEGGG